MKQSRRSSSPLFFCFFGICALVFALTSVWVVVRTLDIRWNASETSSLDAYLTKKVVKSLLPEQPQNEEERHRMLHQRLSGGSELFQRQHLVVWSNDYHIGPIQDLKGLLRPSGVDFIDKSLSHHCHRTKTCARGLRVLQVQQGIDPPDEMVKRFQRTYSEDAEMRSVDAFFCFHPVAMCELFLPFNKSLIIVATTRYEMGRHTQEKWMKWNENLAQISADTKHIVAANNYYDAKYIEYFTGISARVIPSICTYVDVEYTPLNDTFLLAPIVDSNFSNYFTDNFNTACGRTRTSCPKLTPLRQAYSDYTFESLSNHTGIVHVPYQVSTMSIFEQYAMGIPLFFPSLDLLTDWHLKYQVVKHRTWAGVNDIVQDKSPLSAHPAQKHLPDPNCETDRESVRYWLKYADYYTMPYIIYYNSFDDLISKLSMSKSELTEVSAKMRQFHHQSSTRVQQEWRQILVDVAMRSHNKPV